MDIQERLVELSKKYNGFYSLESTIKSFNSSKERGLSDDEAYDRVAFSHGFGYGMCGE